MSQFTSNGPNGQTKSPDRPSRPPAPEVFNIPVELRSLRQWVLWKYELRDGAWTKVPYQPSKPRVKAKADVPDTWGSFDLAWEAYQTGDFDGIGFEFSAGDEFYGVDVDKCLDAGGEVLEWAAPILEQLQTTYGEISPSRRGVKFIARGKLPKKTGTRRNGFGDGTGALELYDHGRFFTLTGERFGNGIFPNDLQEVANKLYGLAKERPKAVVASNGHAGNWTQTATSTDLEKRVLKYLATCDPAVSGQRGHDVTLRVACAIGPGFNLSEDETFRYLGAHWNPTCQPPWDEKDLRRKVAEAFKVESRRGWILNDPSRQSKPQVSPGPATSSNGVHQIADDSKLAYFPHTDTGAAERMVARHGADIKFCHPWKKWLRFDGRRWAIDDTAEIRRMGKATARKILAEASTIDDKDYREKLVAFARACESKKGLTALIDLASVEEGVPVVPAELDTKPWLLNVENGTIDLATGKLRPHSRGDMITALAPVVFNPDAKCPLWDATLARFFAKNDGLIAFWDRLCGIALTGDVSEQILPILYGEGDNGKTTMIGTLLNILSTDYAAVAPKDMLMERRSEPHPTERAFLFGKRLVVAMESREEARLNEALIKQLTGSDAITARRMHEDNWTFSPTHKLMLCTNHKPVIKGTDHAIWRRPKLVPFEVKIAEADKILDFPTRLRGEYSGILARCVRGCLDWQKNGLRVPKEVKDATEQYRSEQDSLRVFIAEECTIGDQCRAKAGFMYERYREKVQHLGEEPISLTRFGKAMAEKGFEKKEIKGIWYLGIGLHSSSGTDSNDGSY